MSRFLDRVKVHGYSEDQEIVILASMLTGEPCLLIGDIGSAKTTLVRKLGKLLTGYDPDLSYVIYNAAHDNFEDIIGFPNAAKMAEGKMEYISGPGTIWGKTLLGVDEINRPKASVSSKWLDTLQDRTMMGLPTGVRFLFGMMNPLSVEGTNIMGEATMGRFASFVWVPRLTEMVSGDRRAVLGCTTDSTLPGLGAWTTVSESRAEQVNYKENGELMVQILENAADQYELLHKHSAVLKNFLDEFAVAVAEQTQATNEHVIIDGRRAGMLYRFILACRSIEIARANILGVNPRGFAHSVRLAVRAGLPLGINSETGADKNALQKIDSLLNSLIAYLDEDADHKKLEMYTRLLTSTDPYERLELLLDADISEVVKNAAWQNFLKMRHYNGYTLGFIALQVEAAKPGTIPPNALDGIVRLMDHSKPIPREINLPPSLSDHHDTIQSMLNQKSVWSQMVAVHVVNETIDDVLRTGKTEDQITKDLANAQKRLDSELDKSSKVEEIVVKKLEKKARNESRRNSGNKGRGRNVTELVEAAD